MRIMCWRIRAGRSSACLGPLGIQNMSNGKTTIQVTPETRDRLFKLKFRRTYDQFLNELCDLYEKQAEDQ